MLWLAPLLLSMSALPSPLERQQPESNATDGSIVAGTSFHIVSRETVAGGAIITLLTSVTDEPRTGLFETTPTQTKPPHNSTTSAAQSSPFRTLTPFPPRLRDPDITVTVTVTSTRYEGQTAETTVFSTSMSTMVITSTNFITSTVTSHNLDTATVTRYVTVTTYPKRSMDSSPIANPARHQPRWRAVARQDSAATETVERSTVFTTVTEISTQLSDSTVPVTDTVIQQTSDIATVDVVVTSVVYPSASTTVTVYSTVTMTSISRSVGATTASSSAAPRPTKSTMIASTTTPATSASPPAVAAGGIDLSIAAKAGIGAGAGGFVVFVAIILAVVILRKRRRNGVYPLVFQPPAMAQQHLGSATAHHGHAELDLRQPTLPDEAAIVGTVPRKSAVHNKVHGARRPPQPKYQGGKSAINSVSELPVPDQEARYEQREQPPSHARAMSEPEQQRTEVDSGPTSQARRSVAGMSTPTVGHTPRPVTASMTGANAASRPAQGREFPLYTKR
jgi:hypothetical protein